MASKKRCEYCGTFLKRTDYAAQDDEFDEELARDCGHTDEEINAHYMDYEGYWSAFRYMSDVWECSSCGTCYQFNDGTRYYWNAESGCHDGVPPKTPAQITRERLEAEERAGQSRMF